MTTNDTATQVSGRERVQTAMRHVQPDRNPVDFLATDEVWRKLQRHYGLSEAAPPDDELIDASREQVMRNLEVDCRLISYDMFCSPPDKAMRPGAVVDWWGTLNRSTPNRMWRQRLPDGSLYDIWGTHSQRVEASFGAYDGFVSWPLSQAQSVEDLKAHPWPEPDWWDVSRVPEALRRLDEGGEAQIRFRIGSVFEIGWQLRGMEEFMMDLASQPKIPLYIMERLTDTYVEVTRRVLEAAGDRLDMVYFYDDVATQNSLMISRKMYLEYVQPCHRRLVELAHSFGKPVMYHCDGAVRRLIADFVELGIDVLNPIQPDAGDMDLPAIKAEFGDKLTFHGGVDINRTLPQGTPDEVRAEVRERVRVMGRDGGYILCSSHHIQPDTPLANVLAMYEAGLR